MAVKGMFDELKTRRFYTCLLAELLGTFFLVLIGCGAVAADIVRTALAFGFAVATIVWNISHVSGGHINPAVTIGFFVTRRISFVRFFFYVAAQVLGGLAGAGTLYGALGPTPRGAVGLTEVNEGAGFGIELLVSFVLVWTVFATCDKRRSDLSGSGPLAIGLSIALCHLFAVPFTGCGMNPARAFATAAVFDSYDAHWLYWIGPLVGGAAAAFIYDHCFAVNATVAKFKGCFTCSFDDDHYDRDGQCVVVSGSSNGVKDLESGPQEMVDTAVAPLNDDQAKS